MLKPTHSVGATQHKGAIAGAFVAIAFVALFTVAGCDKKADQGTSSSSSSSTSTADRYKDYDATGAKKSDKAVAGTGSADSGVPKEYAEKLKANPGVVPNAR